MCWNIPKMLLLMPTSRMMIDRVLFSVFCVLHSKISSLSQPMKTCQIPFENYTVISNYCRRLPPVAKMGYNLPPLLSRTHVSSSPWYWKHTLSTRRRRLISFRVSKHHILNNIIMKKYQHKNMHAKLPIINLKVDQMRFMSLREQTVIFWWEAFVILVLLQSRATLGKGLFIPLPNPTHVSKHQVHSPYLHTLLKQSSH